MILLCLAFAWVAFLCTGNILLHYGVNGHLIKGLVAGVAVGLALYIMISKELTAPAVILFVAIALEALIALILINRK